MAERPEEPEVEASDPAPAGSKGVAAAMTAAMRRQRNGARADPEFDAFLRKQSNLIDLQTEHLHEQRELVLSRLRWGRYSDRMKALLQTLTALVGLAIAAAVAVMAWQAHEDHGLTIAAFPVPPDLAQRGLTGQVVAARVLDRLSQLQAETVSARPASTYANDWGDDVKVEIPETGVSVGELNRYLRQWLGGETRVTGEVVRNSTGLSVTARAGGKPGTTVQGGADDLDALVTKAAEAIYASTQPYRYAVYLAGHGRADQALALYIKLARTGSPEDRRWAYTGWSALMLDRGDNAGAAGVVKEAWRKGLDLHDTGGDVTFVNAELALGHLQSELVLLRAALQRDKASKLHTIFVGPAARRVQAATIAIRVGDFRRAAAGIGEVGDLNSEGGGATATLTLSAISALISDHDVSGARRLFGTLQASTQQGPTQYPLEATAAQAIDDWPRYVALAEQAKASDQAAGPTKKDVLERGDRAGLAIGYARLGRLADAEASIGPTPLDCEPCLEARAIVAATKGDWPGAERWFAALDRQAPDLPFGDRSWGQALLGKGDVDGAIAKLALAHRKSPHFADPLELWGEALMRKGDFAGAITKFAEADTDAPRWGRNQLRWGQALARLGSTDEARAHWRAASGMDLSAADRAELVTMQATAQKRTS